MINVQEEQNGLNSKRLCILLNVTIQKGDTQYEQGAMLIVKSLKSDLERVRCPEM